MIAALHQADRWRGCFLEINSFTWLYDWEDDRCSPSGWSLAWANFRRSAHLPDCMIKKMIAALRLKDCQQWRTLRNESVGLHYQLLVLPARYSIIYQLYCTSRNSKLISVFVNPHWFQCGFGSRFWWPKIVKLQLENIFFFQKMQFLFFPRPTWKTSKLHEKPSTLKKENIEHFKG